MKFRILTMPETNPPEWLARWVAQFDLLYADDNKKYLELIAKHRNFSGEDFRQIGMWKDGVAAAARETKYKKNVAMVAFAIWEEAAIEPPMCPSDEHLSEFLERWASKTYTDTYKSGATRTKQFGLSRATTLLHFLSGGIYPIFDARVRTAIARLRSTREMEYSLDAYLAECIPAFRELDQLCKPRTLRELDKALFSYGALDRDIFTTASSS